ncbi:hypothetical protein RAG06_27915, partial [Klebsiella pneumoniae]
MFLKPNDVQSLGELMLTKKKWAIFSLLTLCGGTIYKLPS